MILRTLASILAAAVLVYLFVTNITAFVIALVAIVVVAAVWGTLSRRHRSD